MAKDLQPMDGADGAMAAGAPERSDVAAAAPKAEQQLCLNPHGGR